MRPSYYSNLKREQTEAIGLLQFGTFLEYFDLMLYIHMAFLLNDYFFPKSDPHTAALLTAFAFCSTYVLRPIGGLFFGLIGDYIGRKMTVIISSMMMGLSCIIMASLPTYEQIGITAAWGVTICRVLQGLACQGEIIGAEIYLTEITKPPLRYPVVSLCSFFASLGGMMALGLSVLLFFLKIDWRLAFWIGAGISSVGFIARTRLRETPVFLKAKWREEQIKPNKYKVFDSTKISNPVVTEFKEDANYTKVNTPTTLAYFIISCGYPTCFYLVYMLFGSMLKNDFNYSTQDLITHNFVLAVVQALSFLLYSIMSYYMHPLKVIKYRLLIFLPIMLIYPFWMELIDTPKQLMFFQMAILIFGLVDVPAAGAMMNHFPVMKRFLSTSLVYAFSRVLIYLLTAFGFVYLDQMFHNWGIWLIMLTLCLGFAWAIHHFEKLEGLMSLNFISSFWFKLQIGTLTRNLSKAIVKKKEQDI